MSEYEEWVEEVSKHVGTTDKKGSVGVNELMDSVAFLWHQWNLDEQTDVYNAMAILKFVLERDEVLK